MHIFPVSSSILSAAGLGSWVQQHYNLPVSQCSLLRAGVNHTYLITTPADKYILRIYSLNWRTPNEISEELRLINLLHDKGIPVSVPIADAEGKYIQSLTAPEGNRYAVLFTYAKGEKLITYPADIHYKIGTIMAQLHTHTRNLHIDRVTYTPDVLLVQPMEELRPFISFDTEEIAYMYQAQASLAEQLRNADTTQIRQGAVHLDIWFDNLNISTEGITLFDFDFCGNGWQCIDIAYYIMQLYTTEPDEAQFTQKKQSFIAGYEAVTPLTGEEKRMLPVLGPALYFFYLGVQCNRFDNFSNVFINETYLKRFITARIKRYMDFCEGHLLA